MRVLQITQAIPKNLAAYSLGVFWERLLTTRIPASPKKCLVGLGEVLLRKTHSSSDGHGHGKPRHTHACKPRALKSGSVLKTVTGWNVKGVCCWCVCLCEAVCRVVRCDTLEQKDQISQKVQLLGHVSQRIWRRPLNVFGYLWVFNTRCLSVFIKSLKTPFLVPYIGFTTVELLHNSSCTNK